MNIPEKLLFSFLRKQGPTKTSDFLLKYMLMDFILGKKIELFYDAASFTESG